MDLDLWSHVMHWFGYVSWCAATSDATCRPFVGFLALLGASGGLSSMFLLGMVRMLHAWESEVVAARAARHRPVVAGAMPAANAVEAVSGNLTTPARPEPVSATTPAKPEPEIAAIPARPEPVSAGGGLRGSVPSRPEPALGLGLPAAAYAAHAEPLLLKSR